MYIIVSMLLIISAEMYIIIKQIIELYKYERILDDLIIKTEEYTIQLQKEIKDNNLKYTFKSVQPGNNDDNF